MFLVVTDRPTEGQKFLSNATSTTDRPISAKSGHAHSR